MNPVFRIVLQQAKKMIQNPKKSKRTMERALKKSNRLQGDQSLFQSIKENVSLFFSLLADFLRGRYTKISLKTGIKLLAALLYFVLVVDLIPDFFAVVGLTDDAAVLAWVLSSIGNDIDLYKAWKEEQKQNNDEPNDINKLEEE